MIAEIEIVPRDLTPTSLLQERGPGVRSQDDAARSEPGG